MPILPEILNELEKGKVRELNLAPYTIELNDMRTLIELLPKNTDMRALLFGNCQFDRNIAEEFTSVVECHPRLMEIAVGMNDEMGDMGARAFADILLSNEVLASLSLSKCNIADAGARAFARILKVNRTLNILDLSNNKISDAGAEALAGALEQNKSLTRLKLEGNKIGYHGINVLAKALTGNQTLVELTLANNNADDQVMHVIEEAFEKSHNIIRLKLNNNHIIPVCSTNKQIAMQLFDKLNTQGVEGLEKEDIDKVKKRVFSLMYVAEYDLRIPRHRILEVMAGFRGFIHKE